MIDKIEIQTKNKNHAIDIALLVDKLEFLQEIKRLRQKWHITELVKLMTFPPLIQELLNVDDVVLKNVSSIRELDEKRKEFNSDVYGVVNKFNRGKNFTSVVEYALVTGIIPEGVYKSCYFDVVMINEPEDLTKPERYQYVMVLSPRTEKKEVDEVLKEFKEHIKGKIKFHKSRIPLEDVNVDEFKKALETLHKANEIYSEKLNGRKTPEEIKNIHTEFLEYTKNAYEFLLSVGQLDIDNPDHGDIIEQYHKGDIYASAIKNISTKMILDRTREWYWMRHKDVINGLTKELKTYEDVAYEWNCKCSKYPTKDEQHKKNCEYCHVDASNIAHALDDVYYKLLE